MFQIRTLFCFMFLAFAGKIEGQTSDNELDSLKKSTYKSVDYVTSNGMKRNGDIDIASAVSSSAGVATNGNIVFSTNGNYLNVRGMGDRYMKTTLNGSVIPTLDPYTNNINLDIFSSHLVDHIAIYKSGSADLRGDWSGGLLSINTRSSTEHLEINVETSIGYNIQSTFKTVLSSQKGPTDWLGYDNSFRTYDHSSFVPLIDNPLTQKSVMIAMGLGPYFASLGVTVNNTTWNDTYFKLGLIQMGLLPKAQFNNAVAVTQATNAFNNGPYNAEAFGVVNAAAIKSNQAFTNTWQPIQQKAAPAFYQSFNVSNTTMLWGHPLGFNVGLQYASYAQYDPNAMEISLGQSTFLRTDTFMHRVNTESNAWSALLHLDYTFNENNKLQLVFMPNVVGINISQIDANIKDLRSPQGKVENIVQSYESRQQVISQVSSTHFLPFSNTTVQFDASYVNGLNNSPDYRQETLPIAAAKNELESEPVRVYNYLIDDILDTRISLKKPIGKNEFNKEGYIKAGIDYLYNYKKSDQYYYTIDDRHDAWFISGHQSEDPFSLDKFSPKPYNLSGLEIMALQKYYKIYPYPMLHSFGKSSIGAGYVLVDYKLNNRWQLAAGIRFEKFNLHWDVDKYDSLGLAPNDPRRQYTDTKLVNPVYKSSLDALPFLSLKYNVNSSKTAPIYLRFNVNQSVARPGITEVENLQTNNLSKNIFLTGNPDLQNASITNGEIRLEKFFATGDYIGVSTFAKLIQNDIELAFVGDVVGYTWLNNPNLANVYGIEIDAHKKISSHFELSGNLMLSDSRTTFEKKFNYYNSNISGSYADHPLFGQAPYTLNLLFSYYPNLKNSVVSVIYNVQGPRLVMEGGASTAYPNTYEMPRNLIDLIFQQRITKHFSVQLKIKDLLDAPIVLSYKFPQGFILDYSRYQYGTNYIFSLIYKY